jgi:PAS domain S-box-containing protein
MPKLAHHPERLSELRQRALERLTTGVPGGVTRATPSQSLAVLHELASSPATAADALAVLHELQVYQVELDLQHEELRASGVELETALNRQTVLYEHAPVGYLTIDAGAVVREVNLAGARLLGVARDELPGRSVGSLLSSPDAESLLNLLECTRSGQVGVTCELQVAVGDTPPRRLHACAAADSVAGRCLVALVDLGPANAAP